VEASTITLSTTNLEVGIRTTIRGKVEEVGAATIDARLLMEFVANLGNEPITLSTNAQGLTASTKNVTSTFKTLPAEEFPVIPFPTGVKGQTLNGRDLLHALEQVSYAASSDDGRPELTGILWSWSEKTLTLAATDSYRLAERTLTVPSAGSDRTVLLPAKLLADLTRTLPGDSGDITVAVGDNQVLFTTDTVEFVTRVIDGQFPDYRPIIPTSHTTTVVVSVAEVLRAIKTVSLFVRPGVNDATVAVGTKELVVSAANTQVGEGRAKVPANVEGEGLSIVFNYRFLQDALQSLTADEAQLEFGSPANPAVVRGVADKTLTALVMPIRA
jgi:DNA polymerase-3 subunit beta